MQDILLWKDSSYLTTRLGTYLVKSISWSTDGLSNGRTLCALFLPIVVCRFEQAKLIIPRNRLKRLEHTNLSIRKVCCAWIPAVVKYSRFGTDVNRFGNICSFPSDTGPVVDQIASANKV